jgi:hypothetical protein
MLQQLAWLGEDGHIHSVKQPNSMNGVPLLGASAPMMGAWLDEDGEIQTINDLQNLRLGAWLEEDGQVHTVNDEDLQNLAIGAWLGDDGEIHTVNDLQNLSLTKDEVAEIAVGVLSGALNTEDLNDYVQCIDDSEIIAADIEDAIVNFGE